MKEQASERMSLYFDRNQIVFILFYDDDYEISRQKRK